MIDMLQACDVAHEAAHDLAFATQTYPCDSALHLLHRQLRQKRYTLGVARARLEGRLETMEEELQDAYP